MKRPLITIGLSFYNNEKVLKYSIESISKQTYNELEIILIDDGSTDGSFKIAQDYAQKDQRILLIHDKENKGLIFRLNQIIDMAQGEYLARMDADDLMAPERLEKQFNYFQAHPTTDVVTTGLASLNPLYEVEGIRFCEKDRPELRQVFKDGDTLLHATMLAKTCWFKKNKYIEGFDRAEDRELFTRTLPKSEYRIVREPLYYYQDLQNISLRKYLESYSTERKVILRNGPGAISALNIIYLLLRSYAKSIVIRIIFILGFEARLIQKKNHHLPFEEMEVIKEKIQSIIG